MIELTSKTKAIFAVYPRLKQVWEENTEAPEIVSRTPHEVCHYMGGNTFVPVFRVIDGVVVEHNAPEDGPYAHLVVADDVPVSLSVGEQECFNYLHLVDLPKLVLAQQEAELDKLEAQLEVLKRRSEA
jgi:hypothetical protein